MNKELRLNAALRYSENATRLLQTIIETQADPIEQAARMVADVVERDGIVYALGSGHSLLVAAEFYYRAGGLVCFDVIHDKTFGRAERLPGYAKVLLSSYPITANDLLILISNSGRNDLPVEMACEAKKLNISTIGITSLTHSRSVPACNNLGLRLFEICDVVIDNCGVTGDAAVELDAARNIRVGPTSTLAGIFIASSIVSLASEYILATGNVPPVFASANVDGGDDGNAKLLEFMRQRIRGL
jgi:uncharacterized phosphosugar-binding protein